MRVNKAIEGLQSADFQELFEQLVANRGFDQATYECVSQDDEIQNLLAAWAVVDEVERLVGDRREGNDETAMTLLDVEEDLHDVLVDEAVATAEAIESRREGAADV